MRKVDAIELRANEFLGKRVEVEWIDAYDGPTTITGQLNRVSHKDEVYNEPSLTLDKHVHFKISKITDIRECL